MKKHQWFKQAVVVGMCTTIGLSTLMATGAGTAPVAAASVTASTGQSIVNLGKNT